MATTTLEFTGEGGVSGLTAGRVPFAASATSLTDSAALTAAASVATDNTANFLRVVGTLPASPSAAIDGQHIEITGAGSASYAQYASKTHLVAGFTGSIGSAASYCLNESAAGGTVVLVNNAATGSGPSVGTFGFASDSTASKARVGVYGIGANNNSTSSWGIGVVGRGTLGVNRIGVWGNVAGSSAKDVGGLFSLGTANTSLPGTAALVADNGSISSKIANFLDNGTSVFSVEDGGYLTAALGGSDGTVGWGVPAASPQAYTHVMAAPARDGVDTNTAGADAIILPGKGTGTASSGLLRIQGGVEGTTGSTLHASQDRVVIGGPTVTLVDNTATTIATLAVVYSGAGVAVSFVGQGYWNDGSDTQVAVIKTDVAVVNKSGTLTGTVSTTSTQAVSGGTVTITGSGSASGTDYSVKITANTSFASGTFIYRNISYEMAGAVTVTLAT